MTTSAVEQADRSTESNVVSEDIAPKELVIDNVGVGLELVDGDEGYWDGVALHPDSGAWAHDHDEDTDPLVYQASENDRASYNGYEDGAIVRALTTADDTAPAPSISEGDVVGVVDTTNADAPDARGRLVEEGYSADVDGDGAATTFSRANGNFLAVGRAGNLNGETVTAYDVECRVEVDKSL